MKNLKWKHSPETKDECAEWKCKKWQILKRKGRRPFELSISYDWLADFKTLATAKKVAQLIHNG
jgi:hypothetical protein